MLLFPWVFGPTKTYLKMRGCFFGSPSLFQNFHGSDGFTIVIVSWFISPMGLKTNLQKNIGVSYTHPLILSTNQQDIHSYPVLLLHSDPSFWFRKGEPFHGNLTLHPSFHHVKKRPESSSFHHEKINNQSVALVDHPAILK